MIFAGIAFLIGVLLAQQLPQLPAHNTIVAITVAGLALLGGSMLTTGALRLPALLALGFSWTLICAQSQLSRQLPDELEGKSITIYGAIAGLPDYTPKRVRFLFDIDRIEANATTLNTVLRVRLSWYGQAVPILVGERWRLRVRLKRPHGFSNPGGFDYEKWLFQQGIQATGYVRSKEGYTHLEEAGWCYLSGQLRQYLAAKIARVAGRLKHHGTLLALSIGDRTGINRDDWRRLTNTGTNHLLAISGLHIGLMAMLAYVLAGGLWRLIPLLYRSISCPRFACGCAAALAVLYAMMSGFALPTQRALVMLLVPAFAMMSGRCMPPLAGIGTALLLVLILDPMSSLSPGFWLSFVAVGVIIFSMAGRVGPAGRWRRFVGMQVAVSIGLAPLLIAQFGQLPTASALTNLLAVPWVSFVVVPLTLLGVFLSLFSELLAGYLLGLANYAVAGFWLVLNVIETSDLLPLLTLNAPLGVVLLISMGGGLLLLPRGSGLRPLSVMLLLPLFNLSGLIAKDTLMPGDLRVYVLDVGQGLAVLVQTQHKTLVYDTGGWFSAGFDAGSAVLVPTLGALNIRHIDKLIISHADLDHRGGMRSLLEKVSVGRVLSSDPKALAVASNACIDSQHWRWDGVDFAIVYPTPSVSFTDTNNRSCVLRISTGNTAVLLPGDIEAAAEQGLSTLKNISADILVAPHHGSKTSSSQVFVDAVKPLHVVYAVGYRNRFGFPHSAVVQRYANSGVIPWRSDDHGALVFTWSAQAGRWSVYSQRGQNRRFWQHKPQLATFTNASG